MAVIILNYVHSIHAFADKCIYINIGLFIIITTVAAVTVAAITSRSFGQLGYLCMCKQIRRDTCTCIIWLLAKYHALFILTVFTN